MYDELNKAVQPGRVVLRQLEEAGIVPPQSPTKVVSRLLRHVGVYPFPNLVVDQCETKFTQAVEQALKDGQSARLAKEAGKVMFCSAMPRLSGVGNIRDFIACVAFAMSLDIIPGKEATRLLYAAQVAHTALTKRPKKRGKSSQTSTPAVAATSVESKPWKEFCTRKPYAPPFFGRIRVRSATPRK